MAYFSNGSEGEVLDQQCLNCPVGADPDQPCPVLWVQTHWNYKQIVDGKCEGPISEILNSLVAEEGTCLMRKAILDAESDEWELMNKGESRCPTCGGRNFSLEFHHGSTAQKEHWIKSCAACGHEFPSP